MSLLKNLPAEPPLERAPWQSEKRWQAAKAIREKLDSQPGYSPQELKEQIAAHYLK